VQSSKSMELSSSSLAGLLIVVCSVDGADSGRNQSSRSVAILKRVYQYQLHPDALEGLPLDQL
jgi:hypothetical protein